MSAHLFHIREHVFAGQHIREYARATAHAQEDVLQLSAKQYVPRSNPSPQPGDVTILAAHANGFVKELYEPLWDELLAAAAAHGVRIRSIWIADVACQGQSGRLNAGVLGNDPSWYDHARDLLHMVNTYRDDFVRPLVGIGHSFGGNVLAHLALLHPRLLQTLVLLDPVLNFQLQGPGYGAGPLSRSAVRRDAWPSRAAAAASFGRSTFYKAWDARVLDRWIEHGLTPVDPADPDGPVTLTTTKHQEVFTFLRPTWQGVDLSTGARVYNPARTPDIALAHLRQLGAPGRGLYRAEVQNTAEQLPHLRPGVCYVFGETSEVVPAGARGAALKITGIGGVGGSGGAPAGRVKVEVLPRTGHLVAQEQPGLCAAHAAAWIAQELALWRAEEQELAVSWWGRQPAEDKRRIDAEWQLFIDAGVARERGGAKAEGKAKGEAEADAKAKAKL